MAITDLLVMRDQSGAHVGYIANFDGETLCVPLDAANRHYAEIAAGIADGSLVAQERPPLPAVVPASITRRQCAKELFARGIITGPEAVALTRDGTPPAAAQTFLNALTAAAQTDALIDLAADSYYRANTLLNTMLSAAPLNYTDAQKDDFFIKASAH